MSIPKGLHAYVSFQSRSSLSNLGDRACNLKKVWRDAGAIGGYALSNASRFVQWPRYEKLSPDVCFRRPVLDGRKRCENVR